MSARPLADKYQFLHFYDEYYVKTDRYVGVINRYKLLHTSEVMVKIEVCTDIPEN